MSVSSPIVLSISFVAAFVGSVPFMVGQNNITTAKGPDCPPGVVRQLDSSGPAPAATLASLPAPNKSGKSDVNAEVYDKT